MAVRVAISMRLAPVAPSKVLHSAVVPVPIAVLVIFRKTAAISEPRIEPAVYMTAKMFMTVIPRSGPNKNPV